MSNKDIFSLSVKLPDDPKEVERMINLLSQPHRGVMMLMEEPSVNDELLEALETIKRRMYEPRAFMLEEVEAIIDVAIAKAKGLKP